MATRWTFEGPNPIIGYTVGFELAEGLSPEALRQVSALGPSLAKDLPRKVDQHAITFQMGVSQPSSQPHRAIGAVVFDELGRDGTVLRQLVVSQNSVTYFSAKYGKWAEYWPVAERILRQVAAVVMQHTGITGFVLNAANKFMLTGDQTVLPMRDLIRPGCKFVAPDLLEKTQPCHCFYGFMSDSSSPAGKRVDNVNFSVGSNIGAVDINWVDLIINVRIILNEPISNTDLFSDAPSGQSCHASGVFKRMHDTNNVLFAGMLTPALCDSIPGIERP